MAVATAFAGCGSSRSQDCRNVTGAEVCLSRGPSGELTATGLQPRSPVVVRLEGPNVGPDQRDLPTSAHTDGDYPPPGQTRGVVVPSGSGPVSVRVTVTPHDRAPATVTFRR